MQSDKAEVLVKEFTRTSALDTVELILVDLLPSGTYNVDADDWLYFYVAKKWTKGVGGGRYIAVNSTTQEVRDLGWLGK
jgi:hypothetical protein